MKGIILAGGLGTRLYPLTKGVSKQMLPVYDKPMIYYPLSVLVQAGINQVLVISSPEDLPTFQRLLEDGSQFGISIEYKEQPAPDGIAQAFILGEDFIKDDSVCLILGDNIFYGHGLDKLLVEARTNLESYGQATIFGYHVKDPERYGIAELDNYGGIKKIEEKPKQPESNYAIVGLYFYPNSVIEIAKKLIPFLFENISSEDKRPKPFVIP